MVSVEMWKRHFRSMAHKSFPNDDMYIVNQTGRGIGRNAFNKTTYKIRGTPSKSGNAVIEIVSPVAQEVERAKVLLGREPIKKKTCRKKGSSKKGRCSGKVRKTVKKRGRTTKRTQVNNRGKGKKRTRKTRVKRKGKK